MDDKKRTLMMEIEDAIQDLNNLPLGSEEYSKAVKDLQVLNEMKNDNAKVRIESNTKDLDLKEQRKDRWIRVAVEVGGATITLMFYAYWMKQGFKFEEAGTFTSTTFRGLIQKFKPTRI